MKLLATTHVPHWIIDGRVASSAYFVRDLRIFADFFDEVHICAPVSKEPPGDNVVVYGGHYAIMDCPVVPGSDVRSRLSRIWGMPLNVLRILRAMRHCDAVHIRCPGSMGLLGAIALLLTRKPRCAKYANHWASWRGEPIANKIQRWLLSRRGFGGPVTVNALWDGHRGHIYSVFNTSVMRQQLEDTKEVAASKTLEAPVRFLFVGRLCRMKAPSHVLHALSSIGLKPPPTLDIIGDGPERHEVEALVARLSLTDQVVFHGWLPPADLDTVYERCHILVLPSLFGEGWPKVLNEAMLHGLPCISTSISSIPRILGNNERGLLVEPGDVHGLAEAMVRLSTDEELYVRMSRAGRRWVEDKTREDLMIQVKAILEESWGLKLRTPDWMKNDA